MHEKAIIFIFQNMWLSKNDFLVKKRYADFVTTGLIYEITLKIYEMNYSMTIYTAKWYRMIISKFSVSSHKGIPLTIPWN